jgi:hypothetical protein
MSRSKVHNGAQARSWNLDKNASPGDVRVVGAQLYLLPVETRVPLKFGAETLTSVTCARAALTLEDRQGKRAVGWGETPLSVQWGWPSTLAYTERYIRLVSFCSTLADSRPRGIHSR